MTPNFIIYLFANVFASFICCRTGLNITDWEYWGIIICIITAFICGTFEGQTV